MTFTPNQQALSKLVFITRVISKQSRHLLTTDQRLFEVPFTLDRAKLLETDLELSERVDAFVGRFGRLQDTMGETAAAMIDNLDKAERLVCWNLLKNG